MELDASSQLAPENSESIAGRKILSDFFEYAVLFSVDNADDDSFQKYMSSLRPLYTIRR